MKQVKVIFLILILLMPAVLFGKAFVNWRAGYHITYPDDWHHVPYRTVNIFLASQDVSKAEFDYDAVLAMESDKPFFEVPYIFISTEPVGPLSNSQIDSVLKSISKEYGSEYFEGSLKNDIKFSLSRPVYDKSLRAFAVKSRMTSEFTDKILLEMRRFYDGGIAIFLCYSPKEMYLDARPALITMLNSFSTENLEKAVPKDSLKIVDLSERELSTYDDSDIPEAGRSKGLSDKTRRIIFIILLVAFILVLIGFVIKKRRK
jgi:hypothetical protein